MNYALLLVLLTFITGIFWVLDQWVWSKRRKREAERQIRDYEATNREALDRKEPIVVANRDAMYANLLKRPAWVDWTAGLFIPLFVVLVFRSFLFEPFRIPSGSMLPTLYVGDFILVNKYSYGVRLPVTNTKIFDVGTPERGDVVVFRYPLDEKVDYIKRVVGLPGDNVTYIDKKLYINNKEVQQVDLQDWIDPFSMKPMGVATEMLGDRPHQIALDPTGPVGLRTRPSPRAEEVCRYANNGFTCVVPAGSYFVLGDNRDNSEDSRYWGFVEDRQLVGRAVVIWANFSDFTRIGSIQ